MADTAQIDTTIRRDVFGNPLTISPVGQAGLTSAFAQNDARHVQTSATTPETIEGETAKYWADVEGYDHKIFEDEDLTEDKLAESTDFLKAAKIIYEMEGATPEELSSISNEDLTSWAMGHMRGFNMNLVNMGANTTQIIGATAEQKTAFVYLMDAYDQKDATVGGFFKSLGWLAADPTTYVGIASFGAGFAAKEAGKHAGKAAIRAGLKAAVKEGLEGAAKKEFTRSFATKVIAKENIKLGAKIGAIEGAIYASADDFMRQRVEHNVGRQELWWDPARGIGATAMGTVFGAGMGGGMSWAGPALGRFAHKQYANLSNRFGKSADNATDGIVDDAIPVADIDNVPHETGNVAEILQVKKSDIDVSANDSIYHNAAEQRATGTDGASPVDAVSDIRMQQPDGTAADNVYNMNTIRAAANDGDAPTPGQRGQTSESGNTSASSGEKPHYKLRTDGTLEEAQRTPSGQNEQATRSTDTSRGPESTDGTGGGNGNGNGPQDPGGSGTGGGEPPSEAYSASGATVKMQAVDVDLPGIRPKLEKKIINLTTPFKSGDAVPSSVEGAPDLPGFKQSTDWGHWFLGRKIYKPWTLVNDWRNLRVEAFMTNPEPIIRPVVKYADSSMERHGILKGLYDLNESIKKSVTPDTDIKGLQKEMLDQMGEFSEKYGTRLEQAKTEIEALRKHVDKTYDTLKNNNDGQRGNDGRYHGLVETLFTDANGVEYGHKTALLEYLDDQIKILDDLQKPGFGNTGQRVTSLEYLPGQAIEGVHELKTHSLHKIFTMVEDAHARLHPWETTIGEQGPTVPGTNFRLISPLRDTQEVNGIDIVVTRQDRETLIRQIANGAYYSEPTLKKRGPAGNTEVRTENMENAYKNLLDEHGVIADWNVESTNAFTTEVAKLVISGHGHEALLTARRLMRQVDSSIDRFTLPPNLTTNANFEKAIQKAGIENTPYYKQWEASFEAATDRKNLTGREEEGWGPTNSPGRNSEAIGMERTYFWSYLARFADDKMWSKPAEVTFQSYWQNFGTNLGAYATGRRTRPQIENGKESQRLEAFNNWWWHDKPAEGASFLKDNFAARAPMWLKAPSRALIGGVTYKPLLYPTLGAAGAIGAEKAYQWGTDDDSDTWIGNAGRAVGSTTLGAADFVQGHTVGYLKDVPVLGQIVDWTDLGRANELLFRADQADERDENQPEPYTGQIIVNGANGQPQVGSVVTSQLQPGVSGNNVTTLSINGANASGATTSITLTSTPLLHSGATKQELKDHIDAFDANILQTQEALTEAQTAQDSAQIEYDTAESIFDATRDDADKAARDAANTALRQAEAGTIQIQGFMDKENIQRARTVIAYKTYDIADGNLKNKTTGLMWQLYKTNPGAVDLMDDKYLNQAQKWAQDGHTPSNREMLAVITNATTGPAANTTAEEDTTPPNRTRRSRLQNDWTDDAGALAGKAGDAYSGLFNWLGGSSGSSSGTMGQIGNTLGGLGRAAVGFFKSLDPKWQAGIGGLIAALAATNFIKGQMGMFGKIPFMGLIIAATIFGGAGKIFHGLLSQDDGASQGNGTHTPRSEQASVSSSQNHGSRYASISVPNVQEGQDLGQTGGEQHASVDLMRPDNIIQFADKTRKENFLPNGLQPAETHELEAQVLAQVASNDENYNVDDNKVTPITLRGGMLPEGPDPNLPTFDRDVA